MCRDESVTKSTVVDSAASTAIDVRNLSKRYYLSSRKGSPGLFRRDKLAKEFWALRDVSFTLKRGERLGIIGHNGAGKSTLLKLLSRVILPTNGEADIYGRVVSLLEVGTGFNENLTGLQNIYQNAALHGLTRAEIRERLDAIINFAEIGRFVNEPVKVYSSGMRSRLGFAIAAHLNPDILMLDEVLSVGDVAFQRKCLDEMETMAGNDRTLLFVSHATSAVRKFCDRCIWLANGEIVLDADSQTACEAYEAQMLQVRGVYQAKIDHDLNAEAVDASARGSDGATCPEDGGEVARLLSAKVLDDSGEMARSIRIDHGCAIELEFEILQGGRRVEPALHFRNERNDVLFVVAYTNMHHPNGFNVPGRYAVRAIVPDNLLNEGMHFVTIALVTADPLIRHQIVENAVSFSVFELAAQTGETARGRYARNFPGGLRPKLQWISADNE